MNASKLFELRNELHRAGVIFTYSGYLTEAVLVGVGDAVKQKLTLDDADTTTVRSVFAVFVEQMQNMIRYSAELDSIRPSDAQGATELRHGILTVGREDDGYFVQAGNLVETDDVDELRARLEQIRALDKDQLKALYKAKLRSEPDKGSKGAGVGLVEIARRSSRAIEFDFAPVDAQFCFFSLRAII
jgi:uncharacterized protein DUF6272